MHDEIMAWARQMGYDLFGSEVEVDGQRFYVLETVDMEFWQIPASLQGLDGKRAANDFITAGRQGTRYVVPNSETDDSLDYEGRGTFFFITSEGTAGQLSLGVEVRDTGVLRGPVPADNNSNRRGQFIGRRFELKMGTTEK